MPRVKKLKKKDPCRKCGDCCRYVAMEIDRPRTKKDYSDIFWYLLHSNISVFIDHDRSWNLEFSTPCEALDDDNLCSTYETRPVICRQYSPDNCTRHSEDPYYRHRFETPRELKHYLRKRNIDFTYVRFPKQKD